jgi:hypothetical protein
MKKGFIIANQHEEFVSDLKFGEGFQSIAWSTKPGMAMVFQSRSKCRKVMKRIASPKYSLWELTIIETASQFIVGCQCSINPPWFKQTC